MQVFEPPTVETFDIDPNPQAFRSKKLALNDKRPFDQNRPMSQTNGMLSAWWVKKIA
jgi:hypothetical protein